MDLANSLIRTVVRAFYETRHILVIDSLFIHSVLHADDLCVLLGMQKKDLRKLCARLREDRLVGVQTRSEIRDGQVRPVNQEYYYIPLHPVIDAIKYRVSKLTSKVKAQFTPSSEKKEYICRRCGSEWTQLEVLSRVGPEGFECDRCGNVLDRADEVEGAQADRTGHEKNSKLMSQLDPILRLLKQIDSVDVPANDFDTAWEHKIDVPRDKDRHPQRHAIDLTKRKGTVRGSSQTDAAVVEVSLTSNAEKSAAEMAEVAKRKAELEKQNALPAWHTESSVPVTTASSGAQTPALAGDVDIKSEVKSEIKEEEEQKPMLDQSLDDKVAAYYAALAKEEEDRRDKEEEEEGSSDDEDEFEDVGVSGSATPAGLEGSKPGSFYSNPSLKREFDSASDTSALQTHAATPAPDEPAVKKVKPEPEAEVKEEVKEEVKAEPVVKQEAQSDDEDEEEFEDV